MRAAQCSDCSSLTLCSHYYIINFLNCQGDVPLTINHRFARHSQSGYAGGNGAVTVRLLRGYSVTIVRFSTLTCTVLRIHFIHNSFIVCVVVQFLLCGLVQ